MGRQTDSTAGGSGGAGPAVAYFAKTPRPGHVKTRLVPPLTLDEAAALYATFLRRCVVPLARARTLVYGWPATELADLRAYVPAAVEVRGQRGEDLFVRMETCLRELFAEGHSPVVIRNTDSPDLPLARVHDAIDRCTPGSIVLGPDTGGGYYLVALAEPCPGLFAALSSEPNSVFARTAAAARARRLHVEVLPVELDVDTFADLLALWQARCARGDG